MASTDITASTFNISAPAVRGAYQWCLIRVHGGLPTLVHKSDKGNDLEGAAECQRAYEALNTGVPWSDAAHTKEWRIGLRWIPDAPTVKRTHYTCANCKSEVPADSYVCSECGRDVS
jgi:DNA-directed RNA polymerase subunit RPC12/RpoP